MFCFNPFVLVSIWPLARIWFGFHSTSHIGQPMVRHVLGHPHSGDLQRMSQKSPIFSNPISSFCSSSSPFCLFPVCENEMNFSDCAMEWQRRNCENYFCLLSIGGRCYSRSWWAHIVNMCVCGTLLILVSATALQEIFRKFHAFLCFTWKLKINLEKKDEINSEQLEFMDAQKPT